MVRNIYRHVFSHWVTFLAFETFVFWKRNFTYPIEFFSPMQIFVLKLLKKDHFELQRCCNKPFHPWKCDIVTWKYKHTNKHRCGKNKGTQKAANSWLTLLKDYKERIQSKRELHMYGRQNTTARLSFSCLIIIQDHSKGMGKNSEREKRFTWTLHPGSHPIV